MTNFKNFALLAVCLLLALTGAFAQTVAVTPPAPSVPIADVVTPVPGPQYSAGAFMGFNHYTGPQVKGGGFFDTKIAEGVYSTSALNLTSKAASITTGIKKFFYTSAHGTVGLYGTAAGGLATGEGATSAVFAGGGGIKVMTEGAAKKVPFLKALTSIPNSYFAGGVDIQQVSGAGVSPTFTFAFGVDFR